VKTAENAYLEPRRNMQQLRAQVSRNVAKIPIAFACTSSRLWALKNFFRNVKTEVRNVVTFIGTVSKKASFVGWLWFMPNQARFQPNLSVMVREPVSLSQLFL